MGNQNNHYFNKVDNLFTEYVHKERFDLFDEFFTDSLDLECPKSWLELHGIQEVTNSSILGMDIAYEKAFERKFQICNKISLNDSVLVQWECTGNHKGDFFGLPASGKPFTINGQSLYIFDREDRISKVCQYWDMFDLVKQIDVNDIFSFIFNPKARHFVSQMNALSARERQCLDHLLMGHTAKQTAKNLELSYRTVEFYFENIKKKLNCCSKRELLGLCQFYNKVQVKR